MVETTTIDLVSKDVPAHVMKGTGLGNEEVGKDHLQTPRVKLLQQLSNEVDKNHSEYIEEAIPGDFINSVTKENYGTELYILNVKFTEDFVVWKKREIGGGLIGNFKSLAEATDYLNDQSLDIDQHDIIQTQSHLLMRKDPETGSLGIPFIMDFASSKLRVSRSWNSQIQTKGGDRFASLWKMKSVQTANKAGQKFMNLGVEFEGWTTEEDYIEAKKLYEAL
jgi:hypothetical protein|tara:strand:+ start:905 stop:1570 length:666 start_codon:yes stop_codon:yes gene_type:complete